MKKITLLVGAAIMILYSGAHAQQKKPVNKYIIIANGDTIINGKDVDNLSLEEKKALLKDFFHADNGHIEIGGTGIIVQRDGRDTLLLRGLRNRPYISRLNRDSLFSRFKDDSLRKRIYAYIDTMRNGAHVSVIRPGDTGDRIPNMIRPGDPRVYAYRSPMPRANDRVTGGSLFAPGGSNTQSFTYRNTDKNGYSTSVNFRIGEARKELADKITGSTTANTTLDVTDLTLFPNFSSGKITLSFTLSGKGATEVKLLDTDLQPVYTDKLASFTGTYAKQVNMPKNGLYYLAVNQGGKWFVKRVVKE
ncbi:hypothetical protein [Hufsiella ginkgonis]|uniref:T9SS type A sorting domain-containing protein n=1 Tax=Hufsiella ginkgonis TaxID=2695274 RepID=A0A7K1XVZ5_9SPHI|nr:hypothetical protein [Hufsiella ginkgonis]MXV14696.1 hypothetical protein [Hufsiella ginkgonis]